MHAVVSVHIWQRLSPVPVVIVILAPLTPETSGMSSTALLLEEASPSPTVLVEILVLSVEPKVVAFNIASFPPIVTLVEKMSSPMKMLVLLDEAVAFAVALPSPTVTLVKEVLFKASAV